MNTPGKTRKRRESWGAIRTLRSGRHQASYIGPDGKRHTAPTTFGDMKTARLWLSRTQNEIALGTWRDPAERRAEQEARETLFGPFAERWAETRTTKSGDPLRPNTRERYRLHLAGPLAEFADRKIGSITRAEVKDWHAALLATGKKTTAASAYILFRGIMGDAVERGLIERNPVDVKHAASQSTGKRVDPPTREELAVMVDAMDERYKALLLICAWGGLRYGEATELRRGDVELIEDAEGVLIKLSISRAVTHTTTYGTVVGPPKSAKGVRTVYLPPLVNAVVLEHLENRVGRFPNSLLFVSPTPPEHHLKQSSIFKIWRRVRAAADRSDMPWHALRHFSNTIYAGTGATAADVMERHGNATIGVSMRYQHSTGRDMELARAMR